LFRRDGLFGVICEQHTAGIFGSGRNQNHALTSMRQTESTGINHSICPGEAMLFEGSNQRFHGPTAIQVKQEGHVLEHQPTRAPSPLARNESKEFKD
jgi:hypothetical protein